MLRLIVERMFHAVFVMLAVSLFVFGILHYTTGDIALQLLPEWVTAEQVEAFERKLGLDLPFHEQYIHWLGNVLRGDFGMSYYNNLPAEDVIIQRFPYTVALGVTAWTFAVLISFPLGILAAVHRGSIIDRASMAVALVGQSVPNFWLGLMLIVFVSVRLGWFPVSGADSPKHVILPALALSTSAAAAFTRMVRSGVTEMLAQDFVRTARAKGLRERVVLFRHVLRNAMLPVITVMGLQMANMLNGAVVIETVFAWPGIGYVLVQALQRRDLPVIEAGVLLVAFIYVLFNLIVDIMYAWIDPRVRYY